MGVAVLAFIVAWTPYFPLAAVLLPTTLVSQALLTRSIRSAGDFRLRHSWPALAVFMTGYVLASGLTYSGPLPANYRFDPASTVQDGSYAELGRTGELAYLQACADGARGSLGVPSSAIRLIELPPSVARPPRPSLIDLLSGYQTLTLGAANQCVRP